MYTNKFYNLNFHVRDITAIGGQNAEPKVDRYWVVIFILITIFARKYSSGKGSSWKISDMRQTSRMRWQPLNSQLLVSSHVLAVIFRLVYFNSAVGMCSIFCALYYPYLPGTDSTSTSLSLSVLLVLCNSAVLATEEHPAARESLVFISHRLLRDRRGNCYHCSSALGGMKIVVNLKAARYNWGTLDSATHTHISTSKHLNILRRGKAPHWTNHWTRINDFCTLASRGVLYRWWSFITTPVHFADSYALGHVMDIGVLW